MHTLALLICLGLPLATHALELEGKWLVDSNVFLKDGSGKRFVYLNFRGDATWRPPKAQGPEVRVRNTGQPGIDAALARAKAAALAVGELAIAQARDLSPHDGPYLSIQLRNGGQEPLHEGYRWSGEHPPEVVELLAAFEALAQFAAEP